MGIEISCITGKPVQKPTPLAQQQLSPLDIQKLQADNDLPPQFTRSIFDKKGNETTITTMPGTTKEQKIAALKFYMNERANSDSSIPAKPTPNIPTVNESPICKPDDAQLFIPPLLDAPKITKPKKLTPAHKKHKIHHHSQKKPVDTGVNNNQDKGISLTIRQIHPAQPAKQLERPESLNFDFNSTAKDLWKNTEFVANQEPSKTVEQPSKKESGFDWRVLGATTRDGIYEN